MYENNRLEDGNSILGNQLIEVWHLNSVLIVEKKEGDSRKSAANTKTPNYDQRRRCSLLGIEDDKCVKSEICNNSGTF